jgi:hypothetical protein
MSRPAAVWPAYVGACPIAPETTRKAAVVAGLPAPVATIIASPSPSRTTSLSQGVRIHTGNVAKGRPLAARVHGSTGVREDKRRALPGQDYARTDERYPVVTISDAILGDSSHHNFSCKTFGVPVLSLRSMLGSMSSNPASICNPTRLHSTHLRSRSVQPS